MKPRRSGRINSKGRNVTPGRYMQLSHFLLSSPAWRSLGPVPRALYIEVVQRWTGFNNGSIGLGVRQAAEAMHVKRQTITDGFRVLIDRGFLACSRESTFDQKRLTREWLVTALPIGDCRAPTQPPTNDFMRWRSAESKEPTSADGKQKPGPFRGSHRAVSGHDGGAGEPETGATGAPNGPMGLGHRAVSGPPYSSPSGVGERTRGTVHLALVREVAA